MPDRAKLDHTPVLVTEVLDSLTPEYGDSYLDLTAGFGGHARMVLASTKAPGRATLVDRDASATQTLSAEFMKSEVIHQDFLAVSLQLVDEQRQFDLILADLGVSSLHLNDASRGFSFSTNAPLDMRMDISQELTAADVVNNYSEARLTKLLRDFGEEPKAHQIARLIKENRPVKTTEQLADLVKRAWPGWSKMHPATRTFQAIRVEVNGELDQLEASLPLWLELLAPGGRLAIISFHSLEDSRVKRFLADNSNGLDAQLKLLTKRPIVASHQEIAFNPRSRSAKLRAAVKINNIYPSKKDG